MNKKLLLFLRIAIAVILLQTLRYKFLAHPDSVYIFSALGLEPYGRIGIGIVELIASILLFPKKTTWLGALLSVGLMAGALFSHLPNWALKLKMMGAPYFIWLYDLDIESHCFVGRT